ncbi:MAG: LamG domain-containing protein [Candidatus Omnitrophota bacterium]
MRKIIILGIAFLLGSPPLYAQVDTNISLNAYRTAVAIGIDAARFKDGYMDAYITDYFINSTDSTNFDYVIQSWAPNANMLVWLAFDGDDDAVSDFDRTVRRHPVDFFGNARLDDSQQMSGVTSLMLDGSGDYVKVTASGNNLSPATGDFTYAAWVRFNDTDGYQEIFHQRIGSGNDELEIRLGESSGDGKIFAMTNDGSNVYVTSTGTLNTDEWYHVAFIRDGNNLGLYLNGKQTGYATGTIQSIGQNSHIYIGSSSGGGGSYLDGYVDHAFASTQNIYNAAPNSNKTDTINIATEPFTIERQHFVQPSGGNMTLVSQQIDAEAAPTDAKIVILEEDIDPVTVGGGSPDIQAYISSDNGGTWDEVALSDVGNFENNRRILTGTVTLSTPTDTEMSYKITTSNNVDLKIHGAGLSWE